MTGKPSPAGPPPAAPVRPEDMIEALVGDAPVVWSLKKAPKPKDKRVVHAPTVRRLRFTRVADAPGVCLRSFAVDLDLAAPPEVFEAAVNRLLHEVMRASS